MMTNTQLITSLIDSKDATILLGNGYNRYIHSIMKKNDGGDAHPILPPPSWEDLVQRVNDSLNTGLRIEHNESGITNPELFSTIALIDYLNQDISSYSILHVHKEVVKVLRQYSQEESVRPEVSIIARQLQKWDVPVITTNYDKQLETCLRLHKYRLTKNTSYNSYYPIDLYYRKKSFGEESFENSFAIWHCSGVVDLYKSLRLDLSDYCNYIAWLKSRTPQFCGKISKSKEQFYRSWLYPFFSKKLIILGLGLDTSEVFLRWLLVRRFAWRDNQKGYYVCTKEDRVERGKALFLKSVGIKILRYSSRSQMYRELFGLK